MWFEAPQPNYRIRGFHRSGYQELEAAGDVPQEKNYRHVSKFAGTGVEKDSQSKGFAYGSEAEYRSSKTNYKRPRDTFTDRT